MAPMESLKSCQYQSIQLLGRYRNKDHVDHRRTQQKRTIDRKRRFWIRSSRVSTTHSTTKPNVWRNANVSSRINLRRTMRSLEKVRGRTKRLLILVLPNSESMAGSKITHFRDPNMILYAQPHYMTIFSLRLRSGTSIFMFLPDFC